MTTREEATKVLLVCKANDPGRFPNYTDDIADAWAEQFTHSGLPLPLLIAGAKKRYADTGQVFTAHDVIDRARALGRTPSAVEQDEQLAALAAKGDSKAACDDCPHHQHAGRCPREGCECAGFDEPKALENGVIAQRRIDIAAYAQRFGISNRQAAERMDAQGRSPSSYQRALAAAQRAAAPPQPLPPDEGAETATADVGAVK